MPVGAEACPACAASLAGTAPPAGAAWQRAPGEPAAGYDALDLAGAGTADQLHWVHGGETGFTGVARDVQQRQHGQHGGLLRVDFRIERHDPSGNRLAPVPAEMEDTTQEFSGTVSNGDEIRVVDGKWQHGTLRVTELDNLTTGARVRPVHRGSDQAGPDRVSDRVPRDRHHRRPHHRAHLSMITPAMPGRGG